MVVSLLVVAVGIVLLVVAADQFVVGAARLALAWRMSSVLVGAVVIGFGTSSPELLVGVVAAARDEVGIAIGSVVGSNIANLTLVAGIAAAVAPLALAGPTLRRELPISVAGVVALALVIPGGLTRIEGLLLLLGFAVAAALIVRAALACPPEDPLGTDAAQFAGSPGAVRRELLRVGLGLLGTVGGAQLLVLGATDVAVELGVSSAVIGLTLVAVGTSLPELVTSIQAGRRGETELVIGNLLGSNLFNSLAIAAWRS